MATHPAQLLKDGSHELAMLLGLIVDWGGIGSSANTNSANLLPTLIAERLRSVLQSAATVPTKWFVALREDNPGKPQHWGTGARLLISECRNSHSPL